MEESPKKSRDRLDLCKAELGHHNLEAAKTECDKAIAYWAGDDEAFVTRGLLAFTRALDDQKTLEVDNCLTGLDADAMHKDQDEALRAAGSDFEHATQVSPDYGEAWADLSAVEDLLQDVGKAEAHAQKALELPARLVNPGVTRTNLGWVFFHEKKLVDAAREFRTALQFQPKMCLATYRLGRVYFERGEWNKAADNFQAVSDDPSCRIQDASLYLMRTKLQQGLTADARVAYDACLKMAPKSCSANACRAEGAVLAGVAPSTPAPAGGTSP